MTCGNFSRLNHFGNMCFFFCSCSFSSRKRTISEIVSPSPLSGKNESSRRRKCGSVDIAENISDIEQLLLSLQLTCLRLQKLNLPPILHSRKQTKNCLFELCSLRIQERWFLPSRQKLLPSSFSF